MLRECDAVFVSNRPRKGMARALLLGSLFAAGVLSTSVMAVDENNGEEGPVVQTAKGPVRGFVKDGVYEFLGIPYAAPPVGALRWMPPQPVKHWDEPLNATRFANTCAQVTELGAFAGPSSTSEDCLYLNVFTAGFGDTKGALKPVLVWIHGGGFVDGESNDYDASKLATGGPNGTPTVVVTINYRLGLFGFLSEAHLNAENHPWGNYGILDQQAALRWVQANITAFGGDPSKVALGGQSAGAVATGANQLSSLATGLFNRAIYQSSPGFFSSLPSASAALANGNAFAAAAGCSDAACLRKLSTARILQLQGTPNANGPYITGPFVDGTIIPIQPETAWTSGKYNHMPIMGGSTRDEFTFISSITEYFSGPPQVPLTSAQYVAGVNATWGANASLVLAKYPLSNYGGSTEMAYDRVTTDPPLCRALHVLKAQAASNAGNKVYGYDFTYANAPYYFPKVPDPQSPTGAFQALASHTIDIQFMFLEWHGGQLGVNLDQTSGQPRELQGDEVGLSDQLVAAWTNFANTGNPNGSGAPVWPAFTTSSSTFLQEDIPNSAETEAQYRSSYQCDFWDPLLTYPTS
jgi:para-nitrobenzyl esterase